MTMNAYEDTHTSRQRVPPTSDHPNRQAFFSRCCHVIRIQVIKGYAYCFLGADGRHCWIQHLFVCIPRQWTHIPGSVHCTWINLRGKAYLLVLEGSPMNNNNAPFRDS